MKNKPVIYNVLLLPTAGPRSAVGSVSDSRARGPGWGRYPIRPNNFVSPSADSVNDESMHTKY